MTPKTSKRCPFESFVSDDVASPFQKHGVAPDSMDHPDSMSGTDFSEPADLMQRQARNILRKYARLEGPKTFLFRLSNELFQERLANALTSEVLCQIDTNLAYPTVSRTRGDPRQSSPAYNAFAVEAATRRGTLR